jgi:hypothetical protein
MEQRAQSVGTGAGEERRGWSRWSCGSCCGRWTWCCGRCRRCCRCRWCRRALLPLPLGCHGASGPLSPGRRVWDRGSPGLIGGVSWVSVRSCSGDRSRHGAMAGCEAPGRYWATNAANTDACCSTGPGRQGARAPNISSRPLQPTNHMFGGSALALCSCGSVRPP